MKLIGVSSRFVPGVPGRHDSQSVARLAVVDAVNQSIVRAGAVPVALPLLAELADGPTRNAALDCLVQRLDGLVLQGGTDIEPRRFGESLLSPEWPGDPLRDRLEFDLLERWLDADKPVLGICRGHQVLNVALGGTLYQDLPTQRPTSIKHDLPGYCEAEHSITFADGGLLQQLHGGSKARVNSAHHQAIKQLPAGARLEASAEDGLIEAFAHPGFRFVFGVQWHPEFHGGAARGTPEDGADRPRLLDPLPLLSRFLSYC